MPQNISSWGCRLKQNRRGNQVRVAIFKCAAVRLYRPQAQLTPSSGNINKIFPSITQHINKTQMIILGIDPGTATTGYGIIDQTKSQNRLVDFGVISTNKTLNDAQRLEILACDIRQLIKKHKPAAAGIEKLFFTTNQKTAMTVSQARGAILLTCQQDKLPIFEFTPLQVKSFICGYGKADKKQVQFMVKKILRLKSPPKPDDAADALAVALCAAHFYIHRNTLHKI